MRRFVRAGRVAAATMMLAASCVVVSTAGPSLATGADGPDASGYLPVPPPCDVGVPLTPQGGSPDGCAWQNGVLGYADTDPAFGRVVDLAVTPDQVLLSSIPTMVTLSASQRSQFIGRVQSPGGGEVDDPADRVGNWPASWPNGNQVLYYHTAVSPSGWLTTSFNPDNSGISLTRVGTCAYGSATCTYLLDVPTGSFLRNPASGDIQVLIPEGSAIYDPGHGTYFGFVIHKQDDAPPVAGFTVTPSGPAGNYQFVSTSTDPDTGDVLTYDWAFDDGSTAVGATTTHQFTTPGTHSATLTVTDSHGLHDQISHNIDVAAPELTVSLSLPDKANLSFDVNEQSRVRVTVHAGAGVGSLSSLQFDAPPLKIDVADRMHVVSGPTPTIPASFSLDPGNTRTFDYVVRGDAAGRVDLSSHLSGVDASGTAVTASTDQHVDVGASFLKVTVTADPSEVTVEQGADGPIPKQVKVTVSVQNTSTEPVDDITLDGALTIQALHNPPPEPIPVAQTDPDTTTRSIGPLDPGETAPAETFNVAVTGDGDYRLGTLVTYANPDDGSTLHKTTTVDLHSGTKLAYFEAHLDEPVPMVTAGTPFVIRGTVENRSSIDTLQLKPLFAALSGNAGAASVVENGTVPRCECGLPLVETLRPGQKVEFKATVRTEKGAGTRANIAFTPKFQLVGEDGTATDLADDKVLVADGSTDLHQSLFDADPTVVAGNPATWALNFSENAIDGTFEAIIGGAQALYIGVPSALGSEISKVIAGEETTTSKFAQVYLTSLEYLASSYKAVWATPEEREQFVNDVTNGIDAEILDKFGLHAEDVAGAIDQFFTPFATAMSEGDYNTASAMAGTALGQTVGPEVGPAVAKQLIQRVAACTLARIGEREAVTLAQKVVEAPSGIKTLPEGLNGLTAGATLTDEAMRKLYGVGSDMLENLKAWARERDIIVGVRYRNAKSVELAEAGAVLKPQNMKLKTVDSTDIAFLGYRAEDEATVVLKEPITFQQLTDNLAAAGVDTSSAEAQTAVSRWQARVKEWNGRQKYLDYAKPLDQGGGIPIGFDYRSNGIGSELRPTVFRPRAMELAEIEPGYFQVKIADEGGTLQRVTGDVDIVDIRYANGKALNVVERAQAYDDLQQIIGAQHGETPTWVNGDGEFIWEQKANLINDHSIGGEPVAQIAPDGKVRAVYINPNLTFFDPVAKESYIWWQGGYRTLSSDTMTLGQLVLPRVADGTVGPYVPPPGWHLPGTGSDDDSGSRARTNRAARSATPITAADGGLGACTWSYDNSATSPILRYHDGVIQSFTLADGWTDTILAGPCAEGGSGGNLAMLPQTSLSSDAAAGTDSVRVNDLSVFAPEAVGKVDWFAPGQKVVIDPGGPDQEVATIAHLGSLDFAAPLTKDHQAGEMVSALDAPPLASTTTTTTTMSTRTGGPSLTVAPVSQGRHSGTGSQSDAGAPSLPVTGFGVFGLLATGLLLVAVGVVLFIRSRPRRMRRPT